MAGAEGVSYKLEGRCEEAIFLRYNLTLNSWGFVLVVVVVMVGRRCRRSPVEQEVERAFSKGGAAVVSVSFEGGSSPGGTQVKPKSVILNRVVRRNSADSGRLYDPHLSWSIEAISPGHGLHKVGRNCTAEFHFYILHPTFEARRWKKTC